MDGPQLFLRFAFMPNRLGYCGAEDHQALLEYGIEGRSDRGLVELAEQFDGAYPYLQLIARANGIADPLDTRVVEAYWLGNELIERVDMGALYASLEERFRGRTKPEDWRWLAAKAPAGARPHHSFHVLDVFPRVGLMRSGAADHVLRTIEQCRIRWGRVLHAEGPVLQIEVSPLVLRGGKLEFGTRHVEAVARWVDGRGFVNGASEGDWVAVHWGWACDVLSPRQRANLAYYTRLHVALANQTL
jgi:hydrogenase maturation factor